MTRLKDRLAGTARRDPAPAATPDPISPAADRNPPPMDGAPARRPATSIARRVPGRPTLAAEDTDNRLIVGRQIRLKGEIAACDRLIVEGHVETAIETGDLQVLPGGVFIGSARVDRADIRGRVDGSLVARERLTIHDGGAVSGEIRYGRVVIEDGGLLTGDIARLTEDDGGAETVSAPPRPTPPQEETEAT